MTTTAAWPIPFRPASLACRDRREDKSARFP
jgi:hypothetical protein